MPRRNLHLLVAFTLLCLVCSLKVSRYGRILVYAMDQIDDRYLEEIDRRELFEGALEGMMSRLDDYSAYISPDMIEAFKESLDKEFGGVGIEILLDPNTKQLTVASPLVGTPAYEAGIRAGDKVLRIDGQSTQGLSLEDAAGRMRGKPGDPVTLTILHQGEDEVVEVEIVRAVVRVDTVLGDTRNSDGSWTYFLEGYDRIGYLRVNSFGEQTTDELEQAVRWLEEHDMQGLILDLRNDPGGLLTAAIGACDLFVDSGVIVTTRRRDGQVKQAFSATEDGTYGSFPIAVLANQYSASASEIMAACLQDHRRAVVVGQRTFGKGTVQEIIDLDPDEGMLKLTTASYWRPSGKNIHRTKDTEEDGDWGVTPNKGYEVEVEGEELAKLLRWRRRRDLYQSAEQEESPDEEGSDAPEDPSDTYFDPQLARAVRYVQEAVARQK